MYFDLPIYFVDNDEYVTAAFGDDNSNCDRQMTVSTGLASMLGDDFPTDREGKDRKAGHKWIRKPFKLFGSVFRVPVHEFKLKWLSVKIYVTKYQHWDKR